MIKAEDIETMCDLLTRAGLAPQTVELCRADNERGLNTLDTLAEVFGERGAPDTTWFEGYYRLFGEHVVLTDEGWMPGYMKDGETEVLMELNAPAA